MLPRIIISLPLVWGIRNFILSGISQQLEDKYQVYYAIPETGIPYMISINIPRERLIILQSQKYTSLQRWCSKILHKSHRQRFPTASDEVFKPLIEPVTKGMRNYIVDYASMIFRWPVFYRLLELAEQYLFMRRIDSGLAKQIQTINPVFALSTSFVVNTEWPLFRLLHAKQVKIYTHILSFDNLTSRGYLSIKFFDKFLVWNDKMAKELQAIYAIPAERVLITGTPQFDFHTNPKYYKSAEWTRSKLGIKNGRYIVYCANHYNLTPDEPQLVEQIVNEFQSNQELKAYQIVLRLHPMDDYERWNNLLASYPFIHISYPWLHNDKKNLFWGEPSLAEMILFSNTLRYSELVLNIASTVSIDAAILDKPVVCVGFSSDVSNTFNTLYHNFHYSDHYAPIMKTGATPLSVDINSLVKLSIEGIQHPQILSGHRKALVKLLCGDIDGLATERIIEFMIEA